MKMIQTFATTVIFALLIPAASFSAVKLQYIPDEAALQECVRELNFAQSLPGINIRPTLTQNLKAHIKVTASEGEIALTELPIHFTFTPLDSSIEMRADSLNISFNTKSAEGPTFLGELSQMMNKPVSLTMEPNLTLSGGGAFLNVLASEGPKLSDITQTWFFNLFALTADALEVGATFEKALPQNRIGLQPKSVVFTIEEITEEAVFASFKGEIPPTKVKLSGEFSVDSSEEGQGVATELSGSVEGRIFWNRQNALLFNCKATSNYSGDIKVGDWSWKMHISTKETITSKRAE